MTILDVRVPQMGEGLREVLILKLLKRPKEFVRGSEVIYVMESNKAVIEGESPHEGILKEWLVEEARVLIVGAPIARIESETGVAEDDSSAKDVTPAPRDSSPASLRKYKVWLPRVPESQVPRELRLSFNAGKMAMFAQPGTPQSFLF